MFRTLPDFVQSFFISRVERMATDIYRPFERVGAQALNDISRNAEDFRRENNIIKRSYHPTPAGAQFPSLRAQDAKLSESPTVISWDPHTERYSTFGQLSKFVAYAMANRGRETNYSFLKGAA